jgi:glycosyltransferase involved in cell wall biosynthesis
MRICYIANANNIHTRRWVEPVARHHDVQILSVRSIEKGYQGPPTIDLTSITNVSKIRFMIWGLWIKNYLKKSRPHLIHAHQIHGPGWLGAITNYHPFVVSSWGSDLLLEPKKSLFRKFLVQFVLQRSDFLTAPSELMYENAVQLGVDRKKLGLIPWGVETDIFKPKPNDSDETRKKYHIPTSAKLFLSPRRIVPVCNIDIVVKAFRKVRQELGNTYLAIIEYNPSEKYLHEIRDLIDDCGINDRVFWLAPKNKMEEMAKLYRMADLVLSIPSSEGYGFTPLEAMACGTPTITTDLPAYQNELMDGTSTKKVPPRDQEATYEAIMDVIYDENLKEKIKNAGLEYVKQQSVKIRVSKTLALYEKLALKTFS